MIRALALAANRTVRSIGASRIRSKPPSSRSATNSRLIASRAAKSRVGTSTPAARSPSRLVRSRPNRKMTKALTANRAIAGSAGVVLRAAAAVPQRCVPQLAAPPAKPAGPLGRGRPEDRARAATRPQQARQDAEQGRLPRAIRPQHREALARLETGADAAE